MRICTYILALSVSVAIVAGAEGQSGRVMCEPRSTVMSSQLIERGTRATFDLSALTSRPALAYESPAGWHSLRADGLSQRFELSVAVDTRAVETLGPGGGGLRGVDLRFGPRAGTMSRLTLRAPSGKTVTLLEGYIQRPGDGREVTLSPLAPDDFARSSWYVPAPGAALRWNELAGETVAGEWVLAGYVSYEVREPLQLAGLTLRFEDRLRDRIEAPAGVAAIGANRFGVSPEGSATYRFRVVDSVGCPREFAYPVQVKSDCRFEVRRVASRAPSCPGAADGRLAFVVGGPQTGVTYSLDGRLSASGAFTGLPAGDYRLTVRGADGCIVEQAVTLEDPERGFVAADWIAESCAPARYEAKLSPMSAVPVKTAEWEDHEGDAFERRTGLRPGLYPFSYVDAAGCRYADTLTLPAAGAVAVNVALEEPPCAGEGAGAIRLTASGGVEPYGAIWDDLGAGLERAFTFAGAYGGTVYDARGCEVAFAADLAEPSPLKVRHELLPPTCFTDENGVLVVEASGGRAPYELRVDSGPWSERLRDATLGVGAHSFTLRDAAGCEVTEVIYVGSRSTLPSEFEPRVVARREPVLAGDTLRLEVGGLSAGAYTSHWAYSQRAWIACDTCGQTAIAPAGTGTVLVSVSDTLGCTTRASVALEVAPDLSVPRTFAPGVPDANVRILRVRGRSGTVIDRFAVYDSNGNLVFEDVDFVVGTPRGWDGTLSGAPAPAGDYAYKVEARAPTGEVNEVVGTTTLVR